MPMRRMDRVQLFQKPDLTMSVSRRSYGTCTGGARPPCGNALKRSSTRTKDNASTVLNSPLIQKRCAAAINAHQTAEDTARAVAAAR
jgi:hypothetical protein